MVRKKKNLDHFSICACHPCAGAMLIFSVSFQFYQMSPKGHLLHVAWAIYSVKSLVISGDVGLLIRELSFQCCNPN